MAEEEEHPVLALAAETRLNATGLAEFFNSTEKYFGGHEPEDWPRDLTPAELARLMPQIRLSIGELADAIQLCMTENQPDPEKAKLVTEGLRLIGDGLTSLQAGETLYGPAEGTRGARTQREVAAHNFPHGPGPHPGSTTGPVPDADQPEGAARRPAEQGRPAGTRPGGSL